MNRLEKIFRFKPPRGFYADMARELKIHYTLLHKNLNGIAPKTLKRAEDICVYLQGKTQYNVNPEILWPEKFQGFFPIEKTCSNLAIKNLDPLIEIENKYSSESLYYAIMEMYFNGESYASIAEKMGRTRERIRQIVNKCCNEIREAVNE